MITRISGPLACLLPVLLMAPAVQADATLTMKATNPGEDAVIEVKGNMVRMSTPGEADYMLFDTEREVAIHVSATNNQYMEINRDDLKEMADSMAKMKKEMAPKMAMMREQLKNMPPEQRAMLEKQMGGMVDFGAMESKPVAEVTTVKRGNDKVGGFKCQRYDVMNGEERLADLCVADSAGAGMSKADFAALSAAMKFMNDMAEGAKELSAGMGGPQMSMGDIDGVPVAVKDFQFGHEYQIAEVSDGKLDEVRFTGYRSLSKQEMPKMP